MVDKISILILWMVPFVFSLSFHEFAHAWAAKKFGDNTAESLGRLSMNPIAHIDPIGTIVFPVFGFLSGIPIFGWAKPVPVNERNLKDPIKQGMWIAAAGPISNIILAIVFTGVAAIVHQTTQSQVPHQLFSMSKGSDPVMMMLVFAIYLNVILAFFNILPIPPLDGGHVLRGIFPALSPFLAKIERYGMIILIALLYTKVLTILLIPAFIFIQFLISFIQ